eukprot:CAMPEP_0170608780 /NCGR_PEP_ID=MMETSP0224-20130122/21768_1 /TAXON_ID=285029 /ORGANISM="Togula jolla, Strain CCCM 725" /LENGTH=206 /DNA_ID=CAMNT_0010934031 /DNA_START=117 /DNA_END=737 /DNA_ORIENTATION=+
MRMGYKIPTELDDRCFESLRHVLKPEHHSLIPEWMKTASEIEKAGIIKLARVAEPALTGTIGRPKPLGPLCLEARHSWYHRKTLNLGPKGTQAWPIRERGPESTMSRSFSGPSLRGSDQTQDMYMLMPSWMNEDAAEMSQIEKPGGYVVKLKDSIDIQRLKNTQRNKGTYKLFGGSFDGTTTQAAVHNLPAVGIPDGTWHPCVRRE